MSVAAGLRQILPEPTQQSFDEDVSVTHKERTSALVATRKEPPPYGARAGYVPRTVADFGDGGAFPEIHVAQFPLGMGKPKSKKSNALAVHLDQDGNVKYDALVKQGHGDSRIVHSKFSDLVPKEILDESDSSLQKPDQEKLDENTQRTRDALEKICNDKISASMPGQCAKKQAPAQYIRYTPSEQGQGYAGGAKQRIIRMVEVQVDPMEPPRFRTNKKIPRGPPSPPAPVMHSPTRKITQKEQLEWRIPPAISNWKNPKGYTIPLDKRLAADGRGLQSTHINENFAKLSEALYIADRKAREAVEMRSQVEKKIANKEKEGKETELRELAKAARAKRSGLAKSPKKEDDEEVRERDEIRKQRHEQRKREHNIARAAPGKQKELRSLEDRDISEQVALGLPAKKSGGDALFDQRLFGTSKGMDTGFDHGNDEAYNIYDKPWRSETTLSNHLYRPPKNRDLDTYGDDIEEIAKQKRFVPDKGFDGADPSAPRGSGPVQFEQDIFGVDELLADVKRGSKRGTDREDKDSKRRR
ncbi:unnamed protein product [Oikopleura dioica]|uniref:SKI-interacting protein SKIP SNW domain-containing protein n=2 Tax=Oikopleura dioica TaxID=34765 RepID=E4XLY3_OIKDI|nr:unnamed protein product [Oikopleura dioica]CBY37442.1 unnamed protein product [Oikopleura dioica]